MEMITVIVIGIITVILYFFTNGGTTAKEATIPVVKSAPAQVFQDCSPCEKTLATAVTAAVESNGSTSDSSNNHEGTLIQYLYACTGHLQGFKALRQCLFKYFRHL